MEWCQVVSQGLQHRLLSSPHLPLFWRDRSGWKWKNCWSDILTSWFTGVGVMVVWWYGGMMVRWYGGMMVWCYGGMMVWWYDGMMVWWYDGMMVWWYDGMMVWWYERVLVLVSDNELKPGEGRRVCWCVVSNERESRSVTQLAGQDTTGSTTVSRGKLEPWDTQHTQFSSSWSALQHRQDSGTYHYTAYLQTEL